MNYKLFYLYIYWGVYIEIFGYLYLFCAPEVLWTPVMNP